MANPLLQDQLAMSGLFAQAMAPLENYGQGLVQIAAAKRAREQQFADAERLRMQRLQDLETARANELADYKTLRADKASDYKRALKDAADIAALKRQQEVGDKATEQWQTQQNKKLEDQRRQRYAIEELKEKFKLLSEDEQDKERQKTIKKANTYGADLPQNATYDEASSALVKFGGDAYVAATKAYGSVIARLRDEGLVNPVELNKRIAIDIADDELLKKVLTPAQRQEIIDNPQQIHAILAKYKGNRKVFEPFVSAINTITKATRAEMEAALNGRDDLEALRRQLIEGAKIQDKILSDLGGVGATVVSNANSAMMESSARKQPPAQVNQAAIDRKNAEDLIRLRNWKPTGLSATPAPTSLIRMAPGLQITAPARTPSVSPLSTTGYIPPGLAPINTPWVRDTIKGGLKGTWDTLRYLGGFTPPRNPALQNALGNQAASSELFTPTAFPAASEAYLPGSIDPITGEPIY